MFFRAKAKNEEMEYLNNPTAARDPLTTSSSSSAAELWSDDMVDVLQPPLPLSHLCIPSCSGLKTCSGESCSCLDCITVGKVPIGHAFDMVLVQSDKDPSLIECSDAMYSFNPLSGAPNCCLDMYSSGIFLELEDLTYRFPIVNGKLQMPQGDDPEQDGAGTRYKNMQMDRSDHESKALHQGNFNIDNADELKSNNGNQFSESISTYDKHDPRVLKKLADFRSQNYLNTTEICARIVARSSRDRGRVLAVAPINMYFWSSSDRIVVCDIDGTITKSNIGGLADTVVAQQYKYCHEGVCQFLQSFIGVELHQKEGQSPTTIQQKESGGFIRILYLTSRPLGLAFSTRRFLHKLRQPQQPQQLVLPSTISNPTGTEAVGLPRGPLLGFTGSVWQMLFYELITHSVHEFKSKALKDVAQLWKRVCIESTIPTQATTSRTNQGVVKPFLAGLGNTFMDAQAYHEAGMDLNQIYIINKKSEIRCLDRRAQTRKDPSAAWSLPPIFRQSDYKDAQKTTFTRGYMDSEMVRHILSADKTTTAERVRIV
ncbi:hypothetical protein ACA910_021740 [Epithemia clementina (nom. ined.)]